MLKKYLLFLLSLFLIIQACQDQKKGVYPKYESIRESVYASVIVEPDSLYKVFAQTQGIIDQICAAEGQLVVPGDPLFKIASLKADLKVKNAALDLELAKENLKGRSNIIRDLESQVEISKLKLQNDSSNYARQKRLWEKGIGTKSEYESRLLAYQLSLSLFEANQNQLRLKQQELETRWAQAENNYLNSLENYSDYQVKSRVEGMVYEVLKQVGESVNQQEPLAYIGSANKFVIKMLVDEIDVVRINVGQPFYLMLDAYENQVFEGEVNQIIPKMNQETQTFWVEGFLKNPPEVLYAGFRGESNILIQKKERCLTIPLEYLIEGSQIKTTEGLIKVKTGVRNLERIEITEGVDSSTFILKPF